MFPNHTRKTISRSACFLFASLLAAFSSKAQMKLGGVDGVIRKDAVLELGTEHKGLLLPRVSNAALNAHPLDTAANGMLLFNAGTNRLMIKAGAGYAGWQPLVDVSALENLWTLGGNTNATAASFLGTTSAQPLVFKTNLAEAMRIDASRRVGIGTMYPTSLLHVNGSTATNLAVSAAATFTVADSNSVIVMNNTADATMTLPAAASYLGRALEIVAYNSNKITFAGATVRTQNGTAQTTLQPGYAIRIVSNGTDWVVTSRQRNGLATFMTTATPVPADGEVIRDYNAFVAKGSGLFVNDGAVAPNSPINNETSVFATTWQGNNTTSFTQLNVNATKAYFRSGAIATPAGAAWQKFLSVPATALFNVVADGTSNIAFTHTGATNSVSIATGAAGTVRTTVTSAGELQQLNAFSLPIKEVNGNAYTLTASDYTIITTATINTNTYYRVNLPQANTCKGRIYVIKRVDDAYARPVRLYPAVNTDYIEAEDPGDYYSASGANMRTWTIQSDGVNHWIILSIQ